MGGTVEFVSAAVEFLDSGILEDSSLIRAVKLIFYRSDDGRLDSWELLGHLPVLSGDEHAVAALSALVVASHVVLIR